MEIKITKYKNNRKSFIKKNNPLPKYVRQYYKLYKKCRFFILK